MADTLRQPNYSLLTRGSELGGQRRGVIYLAKIAEGWCYAGGCWLAMFWWLDHPLWSVFGGCVGIVLGQKLTGHLRQYSGWPVHPNVRDWICDASLELSWIAAFAWHWPFHWPAVALFAAWLRTYPWSQE